MSVLSELKQRRHQLGSSRSIRRQNITFRIGHNRADRGLAAARCGSGLFQGERHLTFEHCRLIVAKGLAGQTE